METDKVQDLRDMVRPVLTLMLASAFIFAALATLCVALAVMVMTKEFELEILVAIIAIVGNPFSMLMTYHFMKSNKKDSTLTP